MRSKFTNEELDRIEKATGYRIRLRSEHPYYSAYLKARQRCIDPAHESYPWYGGRGLKFGFNGPAGFTQYCEELGRKPSPKHTVDRKNNDLGYVPGNIRWATHAQQGANQRKTRKFPYKGRMLTARRISVITGLSKSVIIRRWDQGERGDHWLRPAQRA